MNEILLSRSLMMLAVASELSADGVNSGMQLHWYLSKAGQFEFPSSREVLKEIHLRIARSLCDAESPRSPGPCCVVLKQDPGDTTMIPELATELMSPVYATMRAYDTFPSARDTAFWH
ncbi:hypothetical protein N9O24_00485 [bacterium]|nr:hypothetical protein [bacterium]